MLSFVEILACPSCSCSFFFSSRRRHTRSLCDWSSDVCSSDLGQIQRPQVLGHEGPVRGLRDVGVRQIGRASCRERVWMWEGAVALKINSSARLRPQALVESQSHRHAYPGGCVCVLSIEHSWDT